MKRILGLLSGLILCVSNGYALDMERDFAGKMVDAMAYVDKHESAVWPGFRLNSTPIIGYFAGDTDSANYLHAYAFRFQPEKSAWQRLTINQQPVYYIDKDLYQLNRTSWGFRDIDGQKTFINHQRTKLGGNNQAADMIDIRFYDFQQRDGESKFPENVHNETLMYGWNNQVLLARLNLLEMEILKGYLQASETAQKNASLRDAIAVNQYRASLLDNESRRFEAFSSIGYGLGGYVGWRSLNLSNDSQYLSAMPENCNIHSSTFNDYESVRSCLYYDHFKFSTLVYGLILDKNIGNSWKSDAEEKNISPELQIRKYIGLSDAEASARTIAIMNNHLYNLDKIDSALTKSFKPYHDEVEKLENNYKLSDGIELEIFNTSFSQQGYKIKPYGKHKDHSIVENVKIYNINNWAFFLTNLSDWTRAELDDKLYFIEFKDTPFVFLRSPIKNGFATWQKFKISPETKIVLDGNSETFSHFKAEKKHVNFQKLLIENAEVTVNLTNIAGEIDSTGDNVKIKFNL